MIQQLIETQFNNIVDIHKTILINTQEDLSKAITCIKGIKGLIDKVNDSYGPIVEQAHSAHKEAIKQKDKYLKPLQEIEKRFKQAILVYNHKMEYEQAERIRIANEHMAKVAEQERQILSNEAKNTDNAWDKEILQEKAQSIQAITCDAPGKAVEQEGLSIRKTWKAKIIDINLVPREYLIIEANISALNQHARLYKNTKQISGVEFFEESSTSIRN